MLTRSIILNDGCYYWETKYEIPEGNLLLADFLNNEIPEGFEMMDIEGNKCLIYIFGLNCDIEVHNNGDLNHHVADINVFGIE